MCVSVFAPAAEESACLRQVQGEALEFASADLKPFERTMQNTWLCVLSLSRTCRRNPSNFFMWLALHKARSCSLLSTDVDLIQMADAVNVLSMSMLRTWSRLLFGVVPVLQVDPVPQDTSFTSAQHNEERSRLGFAVRVGGTSVTGSQADPDVFECHDRNFGPAQPPSWQP